MGLVKIYEGERVEICVRFLFLDEQENDGKELGQGALLSVKQSLSHQGELELLVGLGAEKELTKIRIKRAAAKAVREIQMAGFESAVLDLTEGVKRGGEAFLDSFLPAFAEGALLGQYKAKTYKTSIEKRKMAALYVKLWEIGEVPGSTGEDDPASDCQALLCQTLGCLSPNCVETRRRIDSKVEGILCEQAVLSRSVALARDLVNRPGNLLTPAIMADVMKEAGERSGLEVQVYDRDQIKALGMEAFLTVGDSSANPPRLIVLRYRGNPGDERTAGLVGKGVTCDTGGYSLKAADSMMGIKGDMAGAAAVFSAMVALAERKVKVNATAVIPAAENRISDGSYLPGDVISSMAGTTIEIGNTDAEGRLLLADAVTYAIRKERVSHLVDIATLTGAVVNMLGFTTAGFLSNNEDFSSLFEQAAALSGEQYWRLPAFEEYAEMVESSVADVQNVSSGGCGTITAGLFIGRFHEGLPWIHLDIAGTAWTDSPAWEFLSKGATGAGVTTLYQLCRLFGEESVQRREIEGD